MASKQGKNKIKCQAYRNSGRREINKDIKAKRHQARIEHFAKRRAEGKTYEYVPPKTKKEKKDRAKKNINRKIPIAKWDSIFAKLENELNKEKNSNKKFARRNLKNEE